FRGGRNRLGLRGDLSSWSRLAGRSDATGIHRLPGGRGDRRGEGIPASLILEHWGAGPPPRGLLRPPAGAPPRAFLRGGRRVARRGEDCASNPDPCRAAVAPLPSS